MPSKNNRARKDDNDGSRLDELLSEIRSSERALPAAIQRRTGRTFARPMDDYRGQPNCPCGKPKRANSPLCPECAYEQGYIDRATLTSNLALLQDHATNRRVRLRQRQDRLGSHLQAMRHPERAHTGDDRAGTSSLPGMRRRQKAGVLLLHRLRQGQGIAGQRRHGYHEASPTNRCSCGMPKPAAYSRCMTCHANRSEQISDVLEEADTENCERCAGPVNAAKRFCRRCMDEMGAPPSAYDDAFNDRRKC